MDALQQVDQYKKVPAVVLAAGLSSRMGGFKPLMELGGVPLLHRVVGSLLESGVVERVVVVTGHRRGEIEASLEQLGMAGVSSVFNPRYAEGEMLSSLLAGIGAVEGADEHRQKPDGASVGSRCYGFLLAFADQPAVRASTVRAVVETFLKNDAPLALPTFLGKRGHPVVLSGSLIPAIRALPPGDSLRTVVHQHLSRAALIAVDDPSIHDDLDTPEDFARAKAGFRDSPLAAGSLFPGGAHG